MEDLQISSTNDFSSTISNNLIVCCPINPEDCAFLANKSIFLYNLYRTIKNRKSLLLHCYHLIRRPIQVVPTSHPGQHHRVHWSARLLNLQSEAVLQSSLELPKLDSFEVMGQLFCKVKIVCLIFLHVSEVFLSFCFYSNVAGFTRIQKDLKILALNHHGNHHKSLSLKLS